MKRANKQPDVSGSAPEPGGLLWLVVALTAFGLIGAQILWLVPTLEDARENAARLRLEIGARTADAVSSFIQEKITAMHEVAAVLRFNTSGAHGVLNRLLKEQPELNTVSMTDANFTEYLRIGRLTLPEEGRLGTLTELEAIAEGGPDAVYVGPVRRNETLEPLVSIAVPVIRADGRKDFLFAELNLRFVSQLVSRFGVGKTGKVYIVDQEGVLIIDPNLSLVLKRPNLTDRPVVRDVLLTHSEVRSAAHLNERGEAAEASGIYLPALGWGVVSEQLAAETNALRNRILLLAMLSLAIGLLLLSALVANARRIVSINRRLREILKENYESAKMLVRRDLELSRANTRLEELDAIKSEFVSIAAHQLRTPLTGIRWSYQTILDRDAAVLTQDQRRLLESGLGTTLRMIDLVNDLLSVARIEEGRFGIRLRKQPIMPVLEQIVSRYGGFGKEKGVSFVLDLPKDTPLPDVAFDEERIGLVLDNLLDNALKYTEPGGTVTVRATETGGKIKIEVRDTGIGIPKAQLHRVFSKFFRSDNAIRLHTSGTGLGLYVAKNIIERHDGAIEVTSGEGKGSVFSFTLPIV